jgi:hypothetical protein
MKSITGLGLVARTNLLVVADRGAGVYSQHRTSTDFDFLPKCGVWEFSGFCGSDYGSKSKMARRFQIFPVGRIKMKKVSVWLGGTFLLCIMMLAVFLAGVNSRNVFARQTSGVMDNADKLPPDVHPDTRSRMNLASRDEFTSDEDKQAYDHLLTVEPRFKERGNRALGGTGTRLHIPVVADAYRTAWNNLRDKSGVDPKYMELAVLVACRETNAELEWVSHADTVAKLDSPDIVEIIRNNRDPKGLEEKQETIIRYGREMFRGPKVSSSTFAKMEKDFGQKGTLAMTLMMGYYAGNGFLFRAYDQHIDVGKQRPFPDVIAMGKKQ